jgi:hypothetical protein
MCYNKYEINIKGDYMYKIVCPNCGAEYYPQEIFVLSELNNSHIVKDEEGKILCDLKLDTNEMYVCDFCNTSFHVNMSMDFTVSQHQISPHVTKLKKTPLFLDEE